MTEKTGFLNRNQLKYLVIAAMLIDHGRLLPRHRCWDRRCTSLAD